MATEIRTVKPIGCAGGVDDFVLQGEISMGNFYNTFVKEPNPLEIRDLGLSSFNFPPLTLLSFGRVDAGNVSFVFFDQGNNVSFGKYEKTTDGNFTFGSIKYTPNSSGCLYIKQTQSAKENIDLLKMELKMAKDKKEKKDIKMKMKILKRLQ